MEPENSGSGAFGRDLRRLREERGLSQVDAAKMTGTHPSQWSRYEAGRGLPYLNKLSEIATAFGLSDEDLGRMVRIAGGNRL